MSQCVDLIKRILISPIRAYQFFLSPWLGHWCRFTPSCSNYAIEAIEQRGPLLGLYFAARRVFRCHPWCEGGHDPVPVCTKPEHSPTQASAPPSQRNHSD